MNHSLSINNLKQNEDPWLEKDRWLASDIGLKPDNTHSAYYLNFSNIKTSWLNHAAKKFVKLQATIRSYSTCRGYIRAFNHLDEFLQTLDAFTIPSHFNRSLMVKFIQFLVTKKKLKPMSRGITLINLRVFHQIVLQEEWLDFPDKPIIFNNDIPRDNQITPKYISDDILKKLQKHLHQLAPWLQRFVQLLLETGRRVSEVSSLQFNCLEMDGDGDWLLRVFEKKLSKSRLIPISQFCVDTIRKQQKEVVETQGISPLLFPSRTQSKSPTISAPHVNRALNKLAESNNITDNNGVIWKFSTHQFRHTVGTKMINSGVPQVMVQHYLGHESPEMTSRYAHIHNETMKSAFNDFQDKLVDIKGNLKLTDEHHNAKWLKHNISAQSLPNGMCSLPLSQNKCPHANACLTCTHFRTSKKHLQNHKAQLEETQGIIDNAQKNGWKRIVEMNTEVACSLKVIIDSLEGENEQ